MRSFRAIAEQLSPAQPKLTAPFQGNITRRETEILVLMAEGQLNKQIAARLGISAETVKKHLRNIYEKTGAQNKIEALNKTRWLFASAVSHY